MYINFKLLDSKALDMDDYLLLHACRQNRTEDLGGFIERKWGEGKIWYLEQQELISHVNPKNKNQNKCHTARITKKGESLLEDLDTPEVNEDDLKLFEWLEGIYKSQEKQVGNRKKTKLYIALFRVNSQINRNRLAHLIYSFISDEREMEYSQKLEYLFFKPSHMFQSKFDIEQSRLYQYYLKHKELFDKQFEQINDKEKN